MEPIAEVGFNAEEQKSRESRERNLRKHNLD
jgi:hypothetical protein